MELKPCPFCGVLPKAVNAFGLAGIEHPADGDCAFRGIWPAAQWNRRAPSAPPVGALPPTPKIFEDLIGVLEDQARNPAGEIELSDRLRDMIAEARRCLVLPATPQGNPESTGGEGGPPGTAGASRLGEPVQPFARISEIGALVARMRAWLRRDQGAAKIQIGECDAALRAIKGLRSEILEAMRQPDWLHRTITDALTAADALKAPQAAPPPVSVPANGSPPPSPNPLKGGDTHE
jgi:hypothetical protein